MVVVVLEEVGVAPAVVPEVLFWWRHGIVGWVLGSNWMVFVLRCNQ